MTAVRELAPEIEATHRDLGSEALELLWHALENPATGAAVDPENDPRDWLPREAAQPWVTLLGPRKRDEVARVTLGLIDLVRSVPERIFEGDPERLSAFYGLATPRLAAELFEPPDGVEQSLARCDLVDTTDGFRCAEVNFGARLGGWRLSFWADAYRSDPETRRFLDARGPAVRFRDPLAETFHHAVDCALALPERTGGRVNVAFATSVGGGNAPVLARAEPALSEVYRRVLADRGDGVEGDLVVAGYPDGFHREGGELRCGDLPVHAVIEHTSDPTPPAVYRAFKEGRIALFDGPVDAVLNDKRNLALLSEHAASDRFDAQERAFVERHLPWTRMVDPAARVEWRGERTGVAELLMRRREELVIKPVTGSGGAGVCVGRHVSPREWDAAARRALVQPGRWLVQELAVSRPYLYATGGGEPAVHDLVWGTFGFGGEYRGTHLRMTPSDGESYRGIVNMASGCDGLVLEVA